MARRQLVLRHEALDGGRQLEEAQRVGHRRARPAHLLGHRLLGELEVLHQLLVGGGFLQRVEVLAVQVLHQGLLQRQHVVHRAHHHRDGRQPGPLGRPPPPLAGDQLVALVPDLSHEDRLQDAQLGDRRGQGGQRLLVEVGARLMWVGGDRPHRHLP